MGKTQYSKPLVVVVALFVMFSCRHKTTVVAPLLDYVPNNASIVIRINDDATFKSELKNNGFLKQLSQTGMYKGISEKVKVLEHIESKSESLLAFLEEGKGNFELLYFTKYTPELFRTDSTAGLTVETLAYENTNIDKYTVGGEVLFGIRMDGNFIASTSQMLLENLIRNNGKQKADPELEKLFAVANTTKSATLIINNKNSGTLFESLLRSGQSIEVSGLTDFIALDLDAGQDRLRLSGINVANDSLKNAVNLFQNTGTINNTTPQFAPSNAEAIVSYSFGNYAIFAKNQQRFLDRSAVMDTLFNTTEEIGLIYLKSNKAIFLNSYSPEGITNFLEGMRLNSSDYQGNEILQLSQTDFLNTYFNPLVQNFEAAYCTILENAFVFAGDKETLQLIISNFKNSATFNKTPIFETAMELLADESNILFMANSDGVAQLLIDDFSDDFIGGLKNAELSKYSFAAQMVADDGFYHTNLVIRRMEKENKTNTTSPLFSIQLDAELATDPQFVINHRTGKKEIVVQDRENNLYLISTEGKVLWKKQLTGKVQGRIAQIDIYKNGRLQLAFTTDHQFLIVDRNGEEVRPFTKTYDGEILNPLGVFDYDGNKEYRFMVVQGQKLMLYDNKGTIVKGFTYTTAEAPMLGTPKHIRSGKKDYLVFRQTTGDLKILDRLGKIRINVAQKVDFSDNEVVFYDDMFGVTDIKGVLHQIDLDGKASATPLHLSKDHGMAATTKTLVVMNENTLEIKAKKVTLELGLYSKPKIFLLNNKIYVSVTDLQNQKVYMFDSNGDTIPGFPVFGNSSVDLADMDNDGKLELVAKDLDNSLIVYKIY